MDIVLIVFGAACLIGAVVGGGVKVKQKDTELHVPLIASTQRQLLLGALGLTFLLSGGYLNYQDRHRFDGLLAQQLGQLQPQLVGGGPFVQPVIQAQPVHETPQELQPTKGGPPVQPQPAPVTPSDPLAGTWRAPIDGSLMQFRKAGRGYAVVSSKPGGMADTGTATLLGDRVAVSLRNAMIGSYSAAFRLEGDQMSGTMTAAGMRIPVVLTR